MGPPFLALYGLMTNNQTLLQMAFDQCRLYRDALRIPSGDAQGLLRHIVNATGTEGNDPGAWLTGLGWASAGMLRVLATITQSSFNTQMADQTANLVSWVEEILDGAYKFANPLMRNYVNDSDAFYDIAGSSLVAYSTYRLASIAPDSGATAHVAGAEAIYNTVKSQLSPFGFFTPPLQVVDALSFTSPGDTSPESLAFVVLLEAARRDHDQKNVTSLRGPSSASTSSKDVASVVSLLVSLL
ncbi:hypothetical protein FA10DRAFT_89659 [Acaromyces ingoldii]|uniref:Six-hairpin glycosidase n=1 Tax=Acaromyces ingoldii TaxID=215250 RepID=A0A316YT52_9BASI|nr:hypothetical protein FA10DRAFT_89659 [Acaromyces ingoldii]PWN92302.1 hypothetical protein FA10DRAFT_89659 [Acaromyces ingoldii]